MFVSESEIIENKPKKNNIFNLYNEKYYSFFNYIYTSILNKKFSSISEKITHDINIVSETIRKKSSIEKLYINRDDKIFKVISSPLMLDAKVYGVVLLSYELIKNNSDLAITSINLLNFFIILVIIIIILSFFFLRGLIIPLNQLTKITVLEREKIRNYNNINYPVRADEIGILAQQIQIMSKDLKSQMEQLEKFTTDVAHELKNPLTAIKSSSELLLKNKISEENKLKILKTFNKEVNRMNRLISDISNFSRTMTEIENETFKLLNLNKFFENAKKKLFK
jgi:Signal transduction histidine kinase